MTSELFACSPQGSYVGTNLWDIESLNGVISQDPPQIIAAPLIEAANLARAAIPMNGMEVIGSVGAVVSPMRQEQVAAPVNAGTIALPELEFAIGVKKVLSIRFVFPIECAQPRCLTGLGTCPRGSSFTS